MDLGKRTAVVVVAGLVLSACGGSSESSSEDPPAPPSSSAPTEAPTPAETSSAPAPELTLKDACPIVERDLPSGMIPGAQGMARFTATLDDLYEQGDLETTNALDLLAPPTERLAEVISAGQQGGPLVDALQPWLDGISAFADRCRAAGSSALS